MSQKIKITLAVAMLCCILFSTGVAASDYSYEYKTVVSGVQTRTVSGYPSGQPTNGTRFPTGGGFYISYSGGPSASVSITLSNGVLKTISPGITFGKVSSRADGWCSVPSTQYYYKACVRKTVQFKMVEVYSRLRWSNNAQWKLVDAYPVEYKVVSAQCYAVRVNSAR